MKENCKSGATITALNRSGKSEATIRDSSSWRSGYASAESPRAGACRCGRSNSAWPQRFDAVVFDDQSSSCLNKT